MAINIQLKRADYSEWLTTYANYIPLDGEACVSFNTGRIGRTRIKIGTGNKYFSELPFVEDARANEIPYDNSISGIVATNLQDAIDQLATLSLRQQIVSISSLGISTSQFNTLEKLMQLLWNLPAGTINSNTKIVGNAPITLKIKDMTEGKVDTSDFISDGQIEITVLKLDSFKMEFKANLESQNYYPYSWTIVDEFDGDENKVFYWRSPLQNIDGIAE